MQSELTHIQLRHDPAKPSSANLRVHGTTKIAIRIWMPSGHSGSSESLRFYLCKPSSDPETNASLTKFPKEFYFRNFLIV